jgi:hypothetical protein
VVPTAREIIDVNHCALCHGRLLQDVRHAEMVCEDCGLCYEDCPDGEEEWDPSLRSLPTRSVYRHIHYWHERLAQFGNQDTRISPAVLQLLKAEVCPAALRSKQGAKSAIRSGLQRLVKRGVPGVKSSMLEKWIQIRATLTGHGPDTTKFPGFYQAMDTFFAAVCGAHWRTGHVKRKAMIQINYVFRQAILRLYGRKQFIKWAPYFPLLKGKDKMRWVTGSFTAVCHFHGWAVMDVTDLTPGDPLQASTQSLYLQPQQARS